MSWMSSNCKAKSYVHQIADCEFNVSNGCDGFHGVCENIGNQVTSCSVAQAAAAVQQAYGNADASIQDGFLAGIDNTAKSETDITNIVQHYLESQCGAESDMSQTLHATVNCSNSKNDIMTFLNHADQSTSCYISAISQVNQSAVALSSSHLTGFGIGLIVFAVIIVVGIIVGLVLYYMLKNRRATTKLVKQSKAKATTSSSYAPSPAPTASTASTPSLSPATTASTSSQVSTPTASAATPVPTPVPAPAAATAPAVTPVPAPAPAPAVAPVPAPVPAAVPTPAPAVTASQRPSSKPILPPPMSRNVEVRAGRKPQIVSGGRRFRRRTSHGGNW